ncbi:MAG TPA: hypothetical protein VKR53_14425, partial [Puia sp.]|nr:hypothetical protein [Puia sp.]
TKTLDIAYLQRTCILSAQVSFGNNPYQHIFHWEILVGAYFSFPQAIGLKFTQEASGGNSNGSDFYPIGTNGGTATFNGNPITKAPSGFSGFKVGFNIGVSSGRRK